MNILTLGGITFDGALRHHGHRVRSVRPVGEARHSDDVAYDYFADMDAAASFVRHEAETFNPDVVFLGDAGYPMLHLGIEELNVPSVWYTIDTHLHHQWHRHAAALFDHVFCAQQNMVAQLQVYQPGVNWLPLFGPAGVPYVPWSERTYDISFVGNFNPRVNPERVRLIEELARRGVAVHLHKGGYQEVYTHSRAVLNQCIRDDLNLRFFEGAGCGSVVITEKLSHSMNDILDAGSDYLWYGANDYDRIVQHLQWVRANPGEAAAMSLRAHTKIQEQHTAWNRVVHIEARMHELMNSGKRERAADPQARLAWAYQHCAKMGYPEKVTRFYSREARRLGELMMNDPDPLRRSWGAMVLVLSHVAAQEFPQAYRCVDSITVLHSDPEFRCRYFLMKTMALMDRADIAGARAMVDAGLAEFPAMTELVALAKRLV